MVTKGLFPPIEEQLKNANMVMRVAGQPLVHDFILRYAEEHSGSRNGANTLGPTVAPSSITDAAVKILPLLTGEFTYREMTEQVIEYGYQFAAQDRRTAIGRVLRKLCEQGVIVEVRKGKAGAASVYKHH